MPGRARDVTDAELAVLQVLWKRSTATIRDITKVVYPDDVTT
jgi:predicted transcriptional regulator